MRRFVLGVAVVGALSSSLLAARDAGACAVFQPPTPQGEKVSVVTDHRMVLSLSKDQTTIYDQVEYTGDPKQFAWVIPVHGVATVGTSSDALFAALDTISEAYVQEPAPCPPPPDCSSNGTRAGGDLGGALDAGAAPGVQVVKQETVGPYETAQIKSTSASALYDWLTQNGYFIPDSVKPLFDAYIGEGFDFLALKLTSKAGVQAMRPIRVTVPGVAPALPLRAVSAGTGASVGVTLWVVGEGRYEPQNFPWFEIKGSEVVWDYATNKSNYLDLRAKKSAASNGFGWELESSISTANFGGSIPTVVQQAVGRFVSDYAPTNAPNDTMAAYQAMQDDLGTIFHGTTQPRVTRWRADLSQAALAKDMVLTASSDTSEVSPWRIVSNPRQCPTYRSCDGAGPSVGGAGGCALARESSTGVGFGDVALALGAAFFGVSAARRRRRRA